MSKPSATKLDPNLQPQGAPTSALQWFSPSEPPFRLAGFPWFATDGAYRRLPVKPACVLPPAVNTLADCTAGGQIRFRSDTARVAVRVTLSRAADMVHMPATGQCGFDLYVGDGAAQRFYGVAKYDHRQSAYEVLLFEHLQRDVRSFTINFPLYVGVTRVDVGLSPGARVWAPAPYAAKSKIVVYGTSIVQGGCASRPGMAYTNILSRRLNLEVINLGFSGNGRGEPEVARLVAEIPAPGLFVLDYDANCPSSEQLRTTLPEFIRILRARHARVPILVISRIAFAHDAVQTADGRGRERRRQVQAAVVAAERKRGDRHIAFLDGVKLIGDGDADCTVDGIHPTDLGFVRMADRLEPVIRRLLKKPRRAG